MSAPAFKSAKADANDSGLYRRVWRWHFYAGLVCLPFLVLLAVTGGLYLFKDSVESWVYRPLLTVEARPAPGLTADALVERAVIAVPGTAARFVAPPAPGRSAEVGVRTASGIVAVYLDPADGRVIGQLRDQSRLMNVVKDIHSLAIAGTVANLWIEVVAGWAIVLVVSGVFLWWPRGRSSGVYSVRGTPRERRWWRDLHAVAGSLVAAGILFLAVTGMPWSGFWGEQFGRITSTWGVGAPPYVWGGTPPSKLPLVGMPSVPWASSQSALPSSEAHPGHTQSEGGSAPEVASNSMALEQAMRTFAGLGLPPGTPVRLPSSPTGVYSAVRFADDVRDLRVVHLDRYSGAVLADIGLKDYGTAGRLTEWGISIHTGRQFGVLNQLLMLAVCVSIVLLSVSAAVMWWKRRPTGRIAAPPRRQADRLAAGAIAVAALLGLLYPLLGASMLLVLLLDALVPAWLRQRLGL